MKRKENRFHRNLNDSSPKIIVEILSFQIKLILSFLDDY